ncbi:unnamed protein product [Ilex paraguariensis]|uniref:Uncharacterized protein n=1 Tax=Ilex paraguariensis TaxID=185542 RepID=A0ABC8S4L5_9AQUA
MHPEAHPHHHSYNNSLPYPSLYLKGMRKGMDEEAFFTEASGTVRSFINSFTPLTASSSNDYSYLKHQSLKSKEQQQDQHGFVLGTGQ